MINWEPPREFNIPTLAFALAYALVHAGAKSGTNAGLLTGGGCLGELTKYTPGMGGSEDGDGKGANGYGVTGMADGPGSMSTLILVVVRNTEESRGELLIPEEEKLGRLDVDVTEGDDKGSDGDDEGSAEARAVARRIRTAADHMDMEWGLSVA